MFDIRGFFSREAIIKNLKKLPKLKTPVMDTVYSDRPQHPMALVGSDMIQQVVRAMPVIRRGGASISVKGDTGATVFYEPLSIRPNTMVTGAELNNIQVLSKSGLEIWAKNKTDYLRKICRATAEAMAAASLKGQFVWPVQLENGTFENWEIDFGTPVSMAMSGYTKWDDSECKITHVFELLTDMQETIQDNGYGGTIETWAGKKAYGVLLGIVENHKSTAKINVKLSAKGIEVGEFLIKRRSERNFNPKTKEMVPVVADNSIKMIATDAGLTMPYCAVDDLDAKLQAMPFFVKPISKEDPSGWKLVAESKPFPIPNVDGICDAVVMG
ncbi:MAG: hypothetical protein GY760_21195 [Deltaproteobacteria bacterium]|nr:hypothetical protein [Deltaproteobacteria bacterium]